jgi:hyperosmotically inducible protein
MNKLAIALLTAALALPAAFAKDPATAPKTSPTKHIDPYFASPEESKLAAEVRHQLVLLPYYGVFDDLGFTINGTEITLVGEVTRPVLKSDAGNVVARIPGVTKVTNNLEVLPVSPNDDRIRLAAYHAIYGDQALATRYGFRAVPTIHIIVKNGNLRLEGLVANTMDWNIVGIRANGVPGVFSVRNDLEIDAR